MQKNQKNDDSPKYNTEFWGICCESNKRYSQIVCKKFHISMAALDPTVTPTSNCVSLLVERDGCQYLLCNLKPDSILQVPLNLYFDKGENITFSLKGHGAVHLSGYYVYDKNDAGSTENTNKGQTNSLAKKDNKKHLTSFTISDSKVSAEESSSSEDESAEKMAPTKVSPVKKAPASPSSVTTKKNITPKLTSKGVESSEEESSEDDESEDVSDDDNSKMLKTYAIKRVHSTVESAESSDDDDEDDDDDDDSSEENETSKTGILKKGSKGIQNKKLKTDTSTPIHGKKMGQKTPNKFSEVIDLEDESKTAVTHGDMNSSIGRTPMVKNASLSNYLSVLKKKAAEKGKLSDSEKMNVSVTPDKKSLSSNQLDTSSQSVASKKKKKKKSKAAANDSQVQSNESPATVQVKSATGVECKDLRIGNGPVAKKGKLVHVYYTGKLENNKVFDSCQPGSKPFSFKLGSGDVIEGWNLGIEGMKVGGKRKLKVLPKGYKNKRLEGVPPNSTLYFVVELKAVS